MTEVRNPAYAAAIAAVAALSLAGCGSSSSKAAATPTSGSNPAVASSSTGSSPAAAAASLSGGSAKAIDVCATLPAATAAKLSGADITTASDETGQSALEFGCNYDNADDSVQVEVKLFEHDAASTYSTLVGQSKKVSTVNGLGDKAFWDNDGTMYILVGKALIQVNGLDTSAASAALAKPVIEAL